MIQLTTLCLKNMIQKTGGSSFGTDEAEVGQASVGTASVSLRDGEMVRVNRIVSEVRWRDGSLRVMRERTVR